MSSYVCKCIDPPNKYFVKGNAYKFVPKIIDIKVYGDGGVVWSVSKARFLLHFEPINEGQKMKYLVNKMPNKKNDCDSACLIDGKYVCARDGKYCNLDEDHPVTCRSCRWLKEAEG